MAGRWNSATDLDETSERVQEFFESEIATGDFPGARIEMKPVGKWDRSRHSRS